MKFIGTCILLQKCGKNPKTFLLTEFVYNIKKLTRYHDNLVFLDVNLLHGWRL